MPKYFWNKKFGKDKICGITQSKIRSGKDKNGNPYCVILKCNHSFYRKPLIEWLIKNPTCPMCRTEIFTIFNLHNNIIYFY